jgi:hypothetical protein
VRAEIRRLIDVTQTLGLTEGLSVAARWVVRRTYRVLMRDLRPPLPDVPAPGVTRWHPLTDPEIPWLRSLNPAMTDHEVRRRWHAEQECWVAWVGSTLAHYRWDTARSTYLPYLGTTFQLRDGDVLVTEVFTHRDFRGRGLDTAGSLLALHRASDRGAERSIALVADWNVPGLRVTQAKVGRQVAGTIRYWTLGGRRWRVRTTGTVRLGADGSVRVTSSSLRSQRESEARPWNDRDPGAPTRALPAR